MTEPDGALTVRRRYLVTLALAAGATFMAFLDGTVTNLAVADLRTYFIDSPVQDLSWVVSLYAVMFAAFLVPSGRLADNFGRRRVYTAGVTVFTAMSLLCVLAPNLPVLLVARAGQGAGAAAMIPASLALILSDVPPERRAAVIGLWSAAGAAAAGIGPSLGGVLIELFGWRSVFAINLPVGLLLLAGVRQIPRTRSRGGLPDLLGSAALAVGTGALVVAITKGSDWGWLTARPALILAVGVVLLAVGLLRSRQHPVPAVDTTLWRIRNFGLANIASLSYGAALYAWLLSGVLYLVAVWHWSELQAGFAVSPGALVSAVAAIGLGRLGGRVSARSAVVVGSALIIVPGLWLAYWLPATPHLVEWMAPVLVSAAGMGIVSTGVSSAAALSVPPQKFAGAIGLNLAARQVGGALGIAALAVLLTGRDGGTPRPYADILLFCCAAVSVTAVAGLAMTTRSVPTPVAASSQT